MEPLNSDEVSPPQPDVTEIPQERIVAEVAPLPEAPAPLSPVPAEPEAQEPQRASDFVVVRVLREGNAGRPAWFLCKPSTSASDSACVTIEVQLVREHMSPPTTTRLPVLDEVDEASTHLISPLACFLDRVPASMAAALGMAHTETHPTPTWATFRLFQPLAGPAAFPTRHAVLPPFIRAKRWTKQLFALVHRLYELYRDHLVIGLDALLLGFDGHLLLDVSSIFDGTKVCLYAY